MKIWIVSHFWDNGEEYREDLVEYQDYKIFSTYEKAMDYYCGCIMPEYIGRYILDEYEVDTHEVEQLEKSPWEDCPCQYPDYEPEEPEYDIDLPEYSREEADKIAEIAEQESLTEELRAEEEWLTHKGENYEVFEEIKKCEEAKHLDSLNRDLDALLSLETIVSGIFSVSTPFYYDDVDTLYVHIKKWNGREFEDFLENVPFIPGYPSEIRIGNTSFYQKLDTLVEDQEVAKSLTPEEYRHKYLDYQPCKLTIQAPECE